MKTWKGLTLFGVLACGVVPASAGEYFYTLTPFESRPAAPAVQEEPEPFPQVSEAPRQPSPQLLPANYENPVTPASYCSDVRAIPRPGQNVCPQPCNPPCYQCQPNCPPPPVEVYSEQAGQPAPQGVFTAPRATGEVSGPSNSIGLRGLAIHFPALRLELPTIQLPCFVRYRREPEMRLNESVATYSTEEPALYGQLMTQRELVQETTGVRRVELEQPATASVRSQPQSCPPPQTECGTQAEMLRQLLNQSQNQPAAAPSPSQAKPLANSATIEELNREYQARLQELIKERERLIQEANRELQMLKQQQGNLPAESPSGYDNAFPNAPAPRP